MYKYCNVHPKHLDVEDCVKRAIVLTTGMDYMEVQRGLNAHKKITGEKSFNSGKNPGSYVENVLGAKRIRFYKEEGKPQMPGADFCEKFGIGKYILSMPGHWTACIDGVIWDTWDCSTEIVYSCYVMD